MRSDAELANLTAYNPPWGGKDFHDSTAIPHTGSGEAAVLGLLSRCRGKCALWNALLF